MEEESFEILARFVPQALNFKHTYLMAASHITQTKPTLDVAPAPKPAASSPISFRKNFILRLLQIKNLESSLTPLILPHPFFQQIPLALLPKSMQNSTPTQEYSIIPPTQGSMNKSSSLLTNCQEPPHLPPSLIFNTQPE